jgi:serine/threonine-protein kinase
MAKSPDERYPSCGAFAAALRQSLGPAPGGTRPAAQLTHPATVLSPPRPQATTQSRFTGGGAFTNPAFSRPPGAAPPQQQPGQASYQPVAAPFRGTPPSPQSATRPVPGQSRLREWLSDNIRVRAILIGAGVIVVLIIVALTTHG